MSACENVITARQPKFDFILVGESFAFLNGLHRAANLSIPSWVNAVQTLTLA